MRNLTFHLPEYCRKIVIESEADKNLIDTEKSAEEFNEILKGNLPSGMYTKFVEDRVSEYLERRCDTPVLEIFKNTIDEKGYAKGHELYMILREIIARKGTVGK